MVNWLQFAANGLSVSAIILLGAVGLSLLYGIKRFANFAHGDLMTLGAYVAYAVAVQFKLGLLAGAVVAVATAPLVGALLEWGLFARLRVRPAVVLLIASVGVSFALQNLLRVVWGTQDLSYPLQVEAAIDVGLGISMTPTKLALIGIAAATALALHALLTLTKAGKALRATADNYDLARLTGIPVKRVEYAAWGLSCALAAAGGVALGAVTLLNPNMGFAQLLLIFAAVILGGVGSLYGAMLGALVIGVAMELAKPALEMAGQSSTLSLAVAFVILVLVLLAKPEGITAPGTRRRLLRPERRGV